VGSIPTFGIVFSGLYAGIIAVISLYLKNANNIFTPC
jgi:hypothetical protein